MSAFWYTAASIVLGGLISAVISYYFARQSSRELVREAEELRRITHLVIRLLALSQGIVAKESDPETGEPRKWTLMTSEDAESAEPRPDSPGGG